MLTTNILMNQHCNITLKKSNTKNSKKMHRYVIHVKLKIPISRSDYIYMTQQGSYKTHNNLQGLPRKSKILMAY